MTSEQKEAFLNSWFGSLPECSGHWAHGMSGNLVDEVNARFDEAMQAYTRAVPDVPELVRWSHDEEYGDLNECDNGTFVRYDQVAAIFIGLKQDAEAYKINCEGWQKAAKAAEAKLAQIKAQVPVASVAVVARSGKRVKFLLEINIDDLDVGTFLYAAPVASEAETIERLIAVVIDNGEDSLPNSEYRQACNDIVEAFLALKGASDETQ